MIEANSLTLIGRATNPYVQKVKAIIEFLPQFWNLEGRVTGQDIGRETFLFRFQTEEDLRLVLRKGPYHFKQWMVILQKWEPIISKSFPSVITFWVEIIGIPLHHYTEKTVSTIGNALGHLSEKVVNQARVRVDINGLQPLEMSMEISLPSGDLTVVDFVYEKLEKHCFACFSLSHEKRHCPYTTSAKVSNNRPLGVNQLKTLTRLEDDKRRQDNRKRSRTSYEDSSDKGGRVTANDMRDWIRKNRSPPRRSDSRSQPPRRQDSYSQTPHNREHRASKGSAPSQEGNRGLSHRLGSSHRRYSPRDHPSRGRESGQGRTPPPRMENRVADNTSTHLRIPHGHSRVDRSPSGGNSHSIFSRLQRPQSSPTPPPRPAREPVDPPAAPTDLRQTISPTVAQTDLRNTISPRERVSALERLEHPVAPAPSWPHRLNVDPLSLQEVEIQYLDENSPPLMTRLSHQSPASSVFQRLGSSNSGPVISSPLQLVDEPHQTQDAGQSAAVKKRKQGKAKQGKKPGATSAGPSKAAPKRRTVKAGVRTRGAKSPLQGVNLRKSNAVRAQSNAKKKLRMDGPSSLQGLAEVPIHSTASAELPPSLQNRTNRGQVEDFRSPRNPLP